MFRTAYRGLFYLGNAFAGLFYTVGSGSSPPIPEQSLAVPAMARTLAVPALTRSLAVPAVARSLIVPAPE